MRARAATLILVLFLTSCAGSGTPGDEAPELNRGTALVETDGASALLYVTIAETAEQRAAAFARTTSLDDDEGLAFLYFEPTDEAFRMEGRLALSGAFFDVDGEILEMGELGACRGRLEACPTYDPGVTYLGVLAVEEGVFERIGVEEGAVVEIVPGSE
jgi:uncharacterized membrane protein (UPF0127 family)